MKEDKEGNFQEISLQQHWEGAAVEDWGDLRLGHYIAWRTYSTFRNSKRERAPMTVIYYFINIRTIIELLLYQVLE